MEKPVDKNMIERSSVAELLELKAFTESSYYSILLGMFEERLEASRRVAFDLYPGSPNNEKAVEHYGKRKEIEYQCNFLKGLKETCLEELKKRDGQK